MPSIAVKMRGCPRASRLVGVGVGCWASLLREALQTEILSWAGEDALMMPSRKWSGVMRGPTSRSQYMSEGSSGPCDTCTGLALEYQNMVALSFPLFNYGYRTDGETNDQNYQQTVGCHDRYGAK